MDENYNHTQADQNMDFSGQVPEQPFSEKPRGEKPKLNRGFFPGVLVGILVAATVLIGGINLYCEFSGNHLVIGGTGANLVTKSKILDDAAAAKVSELVDYMDLYYYEDVNTDDVKNGLYAGVVSGLGDPYSVYYTAKEYEDQKVSNSGQYCGIGAGLTQDKDTGSVTVTRVYEGTPAEEAGIKKDDVIVKVGGEDAAAQELSKLVQKIRGKEGTKVKLEIYRPSGSKTLQITAKRRNIELPSVNARMLSGKIGYYQVTEFQENTAEQFKTEVEKLRKKGMKSMIVDLRDNPGGMLSAVVDMLDYVLPGGLLVYTQDKYGEKQEFNSDDACLNYPLAVLINENSASASEIFAGAIKDYKYGTLIGTKTFGKGIVQTILPLKDGDAIKITTSRYYTPKGNYIHGVGIEPDVKLEYKFGGGSNDEYDIKYDNQIRKAKEILTK